MISEIIKAYYKKMVSGISNLDVYVEGEDKKPKSMNWLEVRLATFDEIVVSGGIYYDYEVDVLINIAQSDGNLYAPANVAQSVANLLKTPINISDKCSALKSSIEITNLGGTGATNLRRYSVTALFRI